MHQDQRTQDPLSSPNPAGVLERLASWEMSLKGRMPYSSNATFLVELSGPQAQSDEASTMYAIYKPARGERPLWDFPDGLFRREVAAWVCSEMLGWGLVPETVAREGPYGIGSVQRFVDADFAQHYFTLFEESRHHASLRAMCAFDLLINNTDRKSGHCLLGLDEHIYGIDNGLCFHPEPKIRTVIWEFGGEAIPPGLLADVERIIRSLPGPLDAYLVKEEIDGISRRGAFLLERKRFPEVDPQGRCYPWPLV